MKHQESIAVSFNGQDMKVPAACTLQDVLDLAGMPSQPFAVAVNTDFVPRNGYRNHPVAPGDCIDLVVAIEGG